MSAAVFGTTTDGTPVTRHRIAAGKIAAEVLSLGAALRSLRLAGIAGSLTPGSGHLADYEGALRTAGTVVGPVANRIAGATAQIDGRRFRFERNEGGNTLHGGAIGTQGRVWTVLQDSPAHVTLGLTLADGEAGFPGARRLTARFEAAPPARLTLTLTAETDAPSWINLANHSYWRLGPEQRLQSPAPDYLPVDSENLPTGDIAPVAGTRFDFRAPRPVGGLGYDHCLCLSRARRPLATAATLSGGGVTMVMATTEPGLQVYDGRDGFGVALEAQGWPDAPNRPDFPSVLLRPGERYRQITSWSFRRG